MIRAIITVLLLLAPIAASALNPFQGGVKALPREMVGVVLLYETRFPESVAAANYYQQLYSIREDHLIGIIAVDSAPPGDVASIATARTGFDNQIRIPLETALVNRGIDDVALLIVACPGIPMIITAPDPNFNASVMQELALMFTVPVQHNLSGLQSNDYRGSTVSFAKWHASRKPDQVNYMTGRLMSYHDTIDAGTGVASDLKAMLDRSIAPPSAAPIALVDSDVTGGLGFTEPTFDSFQTHIAGTGIMPVVRDANALLARNVNEIAFYVSNGSNAGSPNVAPFYGDIGANVVPGTFSPRAIAIDAVSSGFRSFAHPPAYGQSLGADLIRAGVSGVSGSQQEPSLASVPDPVILFDTYFVELRPAIESYWRSVPNVGWKFEWVGNPLMVWKDQ